MSPKQTRRCTVYQVPNRDYTEPAFYLNIAANDNESPVKLFYNVGIVPGGKDQSNMKQWNGPSAVIQEVGALRFNFHPTGKENPSDVANGVF